MNKKLLIGTLVICLLAFVAVMAFSQSSTNVRWEYSIVDRRQMNQQQANTLGAEGWELVTYGQVGDFNSFVFKRRLP